MGFAYNKLKGKIKEVYGTQEAFAIANNLSGVCVKHGQRGCVIACIDAQRSHSSAGLSCARATVPSRPLTN